MMATVVVASAAVVVVARTNIPRSERTSVGRKQVWRRQEERRRERAAERERESEFLESVPVAEQKPN